jgi:hypothetical protein
MVRRRAVKGFKPRTPSRFRFRELARAVRAAKAAGGERVEVDPTTGKITVIVTGKPESAAPENPWLAELHTKESKQ